MLILFDFCREASNQQILHEFFTGGHHADVITCFKFCVDRLREFRICAGSNFAILPQLSRSPLTQGCITTHLWLFMPELNFWLFIISSKLLNPVSVPARFTRSNSTISGFRNYQFVTCVVLSVCLRSRALSQWCPNSTLSPAQSQLSPTDDQCLPFWFQFAFIA